MLRTVMIAVAGWLALMAPALAEAAGPLTDPIGWRAAIAEREAVVVEETAAGAAVDLPLAGAGDTAAMMRLARLYDGAHMPAEALRWYRVAADAGDLEAAQEAGLRLSLGRGADRDMAAGRYYFRLLADLLDVADMTPVDTISVAGGEVRLYAATVGLWDRLFGGRGIYEAKAGRRIACVVTAPDGTVHFAAYWFGRLYSPEIKDIDEDSRPEAIVRGQTWAPGDDALRLVSTRGDEHGIAMILAFDPVPTPVAHFANPWGMEMAIFPRGWSSDRQADVLVLDPFELRWPEGDDPDDPPGRFFPYAPVWYAYREGRFQVAPDVMARNAVSGIGQAEAISAVRERFAMSRPRGAAFLANLVMAPIYDGDGDRALELIETVWPEYEPGLDSFMASLLDALMSSRYWPTIRRLNGW